MIEARPLDRRIQRTRQLLQEALLQLIIERGYENVTIQDITEQGNLGRTTFYLHYRDKDQLLQESIRALSNDLQCEVESTAEECNFQTLSKRIFQHVARRQQLYRAMLREPGPTTSLGDTMRDYFTELYRRFVQPEASTNEKLADVKGEILAAHAAGSLFGLISWWLNHEISPTPEQMGTIYFQLMTQDGTSITL